MTTGTFNGIDKPYLDFKIKQAVWFNDEFILQNFYPCMRRIEHFNVSEKEIPDYSSELTVALWKIKRKNNVKP